MTTVATQSVERRLEAPNCAASSAASYTCLTLLCAILMFAVLAFGAIDTWSTSVLEIGATLLFITWALDQVGSPEARVKSSPLFPAMLAFGILIAVQIAFNMTVYRYATLVAAIQYLAFSALLFAAVQISGDQHSSRFLLLALGSFGFAFALFATCQNLSSSEKIYGFYTPEVGAVIFGSYVNHDHYAGLMEMLTPFPLVLSLNRLVRREQRALAGIAAVIMAASIVLSQSRAGTISLISELAFLFFLASRNKQRTVMRNGLLLLIFSVLLFLAWIGSAAMWHHLSDLRPGMRTAVLKDSFQMLLRRPILGWGLGTFSTAYPAYQSFFTDVFTNAAHNDYLQVLIETGVLGFACLVWFIVALYRRGLKHLNSWTASWSSALSTAALVGCTGLLVHSAFDFNLQIPANAALFYVLCALATNLPPMSNPEPSRRPSLASVSMG